MTPVFLAALLASLAASVPALQVMPRTSALTVLAPRSTSRLSPSPVLLAFAGGRGKAKAEARSKSQKESDKSKTEERKPKGGANPAVQRAANRGSTLHSDKPGHLPEQLRQKYPETEFKFNKPGQKGQDVSVQGGKHPSKYSDSKWKEDADHGDFKPDTSTGKKTFESDQKKKWKEETQMLPYDPKTGNLK
ncbi:hypothetical protein [Archangium violaceum]|uniref:hypothetical protein n=1 Tax=Archangium violaceum TaxID=83451 RepID=UPI00126A24D4|nr:hypothetical protein [Archangium violaceum]